MKYDVVTVGNVVIDVFLLLADTSEGIHLNKTERLLCFPYGQKIHLGGYELQLGGNACNVAVGLTRGGLKTALLAEVGNDEFSGRILKGLEKEKVHTDLLKMGTGQTSLTISINFQGERTLFTQHQERHHDFHIESLDTKALYLTSLGYTWLPAYKQIGNYVQSKKDTVLAFNPGSVQFLDGVSSFAFLLPLTTILFVNREEAEKIVGSKHEVPELLQRLKMKGIRVVSLTDGDKGAYALDEKGIFYHQEKITCPVVDRTGAGDAYATGFLLGFLRGKSIKECMMYGAYNAASVISHIGAQPGLLTREELEIKVFGRKQ